MLADAHISSLGYLCFYMQISFFERLKSVRNDF